MEFDRNGLAVLERIDCLRRLGATGIGRVAVTVGALPAIFPLTYAQRDGAVYFRTAPGTKLAAATANAIVAFEVDRFDRFAHTGWSVLVVGRAEVVDDPDELESLRTLPLTPWVSSDAVSLVRLRADLVSGRVLTHGGGQQCVTSTYTAASS
jgi:hypothetical protein